MGYCAAAAIWSFAIVLACIFVPRELPQRAPPRNQRRSESTDGLTSSAVDVELSDHSSISNPAHKP